MTYPVITNPKIVCPQLPSYLTIIAQKKVKGVALGCIAAFVHWFLMTFSWFYPKYKEFVHWCSGLSKTASPESSKEEYFEKFIDNTGILDNFPDKDERLHYFSEGIGLFDLTDQRIVSCREPFISGRCTRNQLDFVRYDRDVSIRINSKRVLFNVMQEYPKHPFNRKKKQIM